MQVILCFIIALGVWGIRSIFPPVELADLQILDYFFRLKPLELVDHKIVIVGITENDIKNLDTYPIIDKKLADLLIKIKAQNPAAIGLDIIRDRPQPPGQEELVEVFTTTPNLIGAGTLLKNSSGQSLDFPPVLRELGQVGDIATPMDTDSKIRRGYFFTRDEVTKNLPSLSFYLAFLYLQKYCVRGEQIDLDYQLVTTINKNLDCNLLTGKDTKKTFFKKFSSSDGGYINSQDGLFQVIINWRKHPTPFKQVSLFEVLENKIKSNLFTDKIVLIGSTAPSVGDTFITPLSSIGGEYPAKHFGVINIAHLTSQIVNAVLEGRTLIRVIPDYWEFLQLWASILLISVILRKINPNPIHYYLKVLIIIGLGSFSIIIVHYLTFIYSGFWIPSVPLLIGINLTTLVYISWVIYQYREKKSLIPEQLNSIITNELSDPIFQVKAFINNFQPTLQKLMNSLQERESLMWLNDSLERLSEIPDKKFPSLDPIYYYNCPNFNNWVKELILTRINQIQIRIFEINDIEVSFDFDDKLFSNVIIPNKMDFVLITLLENSLESVVEKKEESQSLKPEIVIGTIKYFNEIVLIVRDNGKGINPKVANSIFEPFFTTKNSHNGLGLYYSTEIIQKIGGTIKVSFSNENVTEFLVKIPFSST